MSKMMRRRQYRPWQRIASGALDLGDFGALLSLHQNALGALRSRDGLQKKLLDFLVEADLINPAQLRQARQEQTDSGEELFAIFLRHRWLDFQGMDILLAAQRQHASSKPKTKHFRLGEILIATGQITQEELDHCLREQKITGKKIGESLIDAGYVKAHQVVEALLLQMLIMTSSLAALLMTTLIIGMLAGMREAMAADNTNTLTVSARVLKHASVNVLVMPTTLTITVSDVARGYVDIPQAARVQLRSNSPDGFMLDFGNANEFVSGIEITGLGKQASLGGQGGAIISSGIQRQTVVDLGFRFRLAQNAVPGTYQWPLQMNVTPL